ncbi:MAG: 4-hydroxy-tetrahydrodipicolinate synthase [Deltaproteobacteria bacterium]|nr:4-hydroxy-tetrahydrodipicolinate synthase [Deltaproteobacteria bacterium]
MESSGNSVNQVERCFDFRGVGTALITPFEEDLSIDLEALDVLVERQLNSGIKCLVVAGTTGEAATLTDAEWASLVKRIVDRTKGRGLVIVGAGTNSTRSTIEKCIKAFDLGGDAVLLVTPYYNKPSQEGLLVHFSEVASKVDGPIVIYNVPGRTGVNILPDTVLKLASQFKNIVGIKESSGSLNQIMELILKRPVGFKVYSGDDHLAFASISLGGDGVISVVSNEIPNEMNKLVEFLFENRLLEARSLHFKFLKLMEMNFIETNPAPCKFILSEMNLIKNVLRPPLVPVRPDSETVLRDLVRSLELI